MNILWFQAVWAGIIATAMMTIVMYAGKIMGLSSDMPRAIGLVFVEPEHESRVYAVGFVVHFLLGIVFGITYAILFHLVGAGTYVGATALWGALFGVLHGIFIGFLLGFMPAMHPRVGIGEVMAPPGFFGRNISVAMPLGLIVLHVIYGAMVGVVYGSPL